MACRPPGLVQSVLAPVMGLSSINLAYSPGAKRIDVLARSVSSLSYVAYMSDILAL